MSFDTKSAVAKEMLSNEQPYKKPKAVCGFIGCSSSEKPFKDVQVDVDFN